MDITQKRKRYWEKNTVEVSRYDRLANIASWHTSVTAQGRKVIKPAYDGTSYTGQSLWPEQKLRESHMHMSHNETQVTVETAVRKR